MPQAFKRLPRHDARTIIPAMKSKMLAIALPVALLAAASTTAAAKGVKVELKDGQGNSVGIAKIEPMNTGVEVKLDLHGLPPGDHGIHFHQNAKCDAPDFKSAGGHFNPETRQHGLQNPQGHHAGDMLNITVGSNGKAKAQISNNDVTLG